jgi:hypothetical protein
MANSALFEINKNTISTIIDKQNQESSYNSDFMSLLEETFYVTI